MISCYNLITAEGGLKMTRFTNEEIELWIDNDESLYNWACSWMKMHAKSSIQKFISENRQFLVDYISKKVA